MVNSHSFICIAGIRVLDLCYCILYIHTPFFVNPGLGVYHQGQGWPMGTNAPPPWLQLTLQS